MQKGSVSIAGYDLRTEPEKVRESIGIVFQELTLDRDMTVREILEYHGRGSIPCQKLQDRQELMSCLTWLSLRESGILYNKAP